MGREEEERIENEIESETKTEMDGKYENRRGRKRRVEERGEK